jgi:hypothetical protein
VKPTEDLIEQKEDKFYSIFLDKAIDYADGDGKCDGVQFRQLVASAGVVAKQRQTRGAMKALSHQIWRDEQNFTNKRLQIDKNKSVT